MTKRRFDQPERSGKTTWPCPVVANGRPYLRDHDTLLSRPDQSICGWVGSNSRPLWSIISMIARARASVSTPRESSEDTDRR
jgi:hypothetical protein